jgi:hypothetical protein
MNSLYQISYINETKEGIEVKARILEGEYKDVSITRDSISITEKQFTNPKVIETLTVNFPIKTTREEINKYFNDKLDTDKTRISIWKK